MTQEDGSLVGLVDLTIDEEGSFTDEGRDFSYVTMIVMATLTNRGPGEVCVVIVWSGTYFCSYH